MEVDSNPKVKETLFVKPVEVIMVNVTKRLDTKAEEVNMLGYTE